MEFIDKIQEVASRINNQIDHIQTEEATKNAFVMPFIQALGYDVFNPLEVVPEFTADIGTKKGEKVDYAVKKDGHIIMLFECKWCGADLNDVNAAQLYRYFTASEARFGILTNGLIYHFYTDLDQTNIMDNKPFFVFNIKQFEDHHLDQLRKFTKSAFDLDNILTTASTLKYTNEIKKYFNAQLNEPNSEFVRFFAGQVYSGRLTQTAIEQFTPIVRSALNQFIRDKVNERLKSALDADTTQEDEQELAEELSEDKTKGIVTTDEENEGLMIVKAIVREVVDVKRIFMRDTKSYCGIILDDNNRKPICRLHFNTTQKYLGLITNKAEEKVPINDLNEIFNYADRLKTTVKEYE